MSDSDDLPSDEPDDDDGEPAAKPPRGSACGRDMRAGKIPLPGWNRPAPARSAGLDSEGRMNESTVALAGALEAPRRQGAGGSDDFVSQEIYEKHKKRAESRKTMRSKR